MNSKSGLKAVWIDERLHERLKRSCKEKKPKTNLGERAEVLIEKGLRAEQLGLSLCPESSL